MIDISLWRAAVGRFHLACVARSLRFRTGVSVSDDSGDKLSVGDVCTSWIIIVLFVSIAGCAKELLVTAALSPFTLSNFNFSNISYVTDSSVNVAVENTVPVLSVFTVLTQCVTVLCVSLCAALAFLWRRVLLSGDVELNPGPGKNVNIESEQDLAMAAARGDKFKQLEDSLQSKLDTILAQISSQSNILKEQQTTMQKQGELLQQQNDALRKFGAEQEAMKETVTGLCSVITEVKSSVQRHEQAIDEVSDKQDRLYETVANLEAEVDRLEGFSRRNNIKFFGIPEANSGEEDDCAQAVLNVLSTYIPQEKWGAETIERAHRLGHFIPNKPNPRPVIVKFQSWRDAIRVMKDRSARDDMEHDGLRVAQDLTRRQVETLKGLRSEGKVAFYVNGKLKVRENDGDQRFNARGRSRGGRGQHVSQQRGRGRGGRGQHVSKQHSSASGGPIGLVGSADLTSPFELPISEFPSLADVAKPQGNTITGGTPVSGNLNTSRPHTRSYVSTRQLSMIESWSKGDKNVSTLRANNDSRPNNDSRSNDSSNSAASANGKK
jgi:hypothetical protein